MFLAVGFGFVSDRVTEDAFAAECSPAIYASANQDAVIRENPDTNSAYVGSVSAGQIVHSDCPALKVLDTESGVTFASARCSCASDGVGWVRADAVGRQ